MQTYKWRNVDTYKNNEDVDTCNNKEKQRLIKTKKIHAAYSHRMYMLKYASIHIHPVHTHTIPHTKYACCVRDTHSYNSCLLLCARNSCSSVPQQSTCRSTQKI